MKFTIGMDRYKIQFGAIPSPCLTSEQLTRSAEICAKHFLRYDTDDMNPVDMFADINRELSEANLNNFQFAAYPDPYNGKLTIHVLAISLYPSTDSIYCQISKWNQTNDFASEVSLAICALYSSSSQIRRNKI